MEEIARDTTAMQAAAEAHATRLAGKEQLRLKFFTPIAKLFRVRLDYFDGEFAADMAAKTIDIPDENLTSPKPSVAIPAMEGLVYSRDEPDLKELYLNLLTAASDNRRTDEAHPSFADIIKQLASDEAAMLLRVLRRSQLPVIRIKKTWHAPHGVGFNILQSHILDWAEVDTAIKQEIPNAPMYVDNWSRLGLVEVTYAEFLADEAQYAWVESRPEFVRAKATHENLGVATVGFDKGIFRSTDFGRGFYNAVNS